MHVIQVMILNHQYGRKKELGGLYRHTDTASTQISSSKGIRLLPPGETYIC